MRRERRALAERGLPPDPRAAAVNRGALAAALKAKVRGEVRFDNGSRALYATDGSNYRQTPIGVFVPRDEDDVGAAVLSAAVKWLAGIGPQRRLPQFAKHTFRHWFGRRGPRNLDRPKVLFWPDTFNNYFHPEVAQAAIEVLEAAGYQATIPGRTLCGGRPLYDFGMLSTAKRLLRQTVNWRRNWPKTAPSSAEVIQAAIRGDAPQPVRSASPCLAASDR